MRLATAILLVLAHPALARAQGAAARPTLASGTYDLTLCYPSCDRRGAIVGMGILVIQEDTLVFPFDLATQKRLRDASIWRVGRSAPTACFLVRAQDVVHGREFYPSITPAGLTSVVPTAAGLEIGLYRSPDAAFTIEVRRATSEHFLGVGRQRDWTGHRWKAGEVEGRRVGAPDPQRCHPDSIPR